MTQEREPELNGEYSRWLACNALKPLDLQRLRSEAADLSYQPRFSLIALTLAHTQFDERVVSELISSISEQAYEAWELIIPGSDLCGSQRPQRGAIDDRRVKIVPIEKPQTLESLWTAMLAAADGDFVVRLDEGGVLTPQALLQFARALNIDIALDILYADHDSLDATGHRFDPFFKPNWSPELLLSTNYIGPMCVYRRSLLRQIELERPCSSASIQGYDLILRATEKTTKVFHVADVVFSRHIALPSRETSAAITAPQVKRIVADTLTRRGLSAAVELGRHFEQWRIRYSLTERPEVSIVLPTGGKLQFLYPCLNSILRESTYENFCVLVVDNSVDQQVRGLVESFANHDSRVTYTEFRQKPFDFSAICNFGVAAVTSPYVLLLNDDIEVVSPDWIETMLEHAQRSDVGVVGAKLLFPSGAIQHAGVVLGPFRGSVHAFRELPDIQSGYFGMPHVARECSAVTFACALMRRSLYHEAGGLSSDFRVAFQDVDMCLRIGSLGYRNIYTPHAVLVHYESATKTSLAEPGEMERLRALWGHLIERDPYYSPSFTQDGRDYRL